MLTLGSGKLWYRPCFYSLRKLDVPQELLEDPTITGDHGKRCRTYLLRESGTAVQKRSTGFPPKKKLNDVIQQMAGYSNRMVNEASPDCRYPSGGRFPRQYCAGAGGHRRSAVTIRSFRKIRSVWRISSGWGKLSHQEAQIY